MATTRETKPRGPRTALGKERSKHNARTHGIFSKVVLLEGESEVEFNALLNGLRQHFGPVGALEEYLVDHLAATLWRQRRHLIAEAAEIEARRAFVEWDERLRQMAETDTLDRARHSSALLRRIASAEALDAAVAELEKIELFVKYEGPNVERDGPALLLLYGRSKVVGHEFHYSYLALARMASEPEDVRVQHGSLPPEECKSELLRLLGEEKQSVLRLQKERETIEAKRMKLEALRQNVPDSPRLDQLLRYGTALERTFDRTLSQLERAQRMRLGQPVPPPIHVNVSSS